MANRRFRGHRWDPANSLAQLFLCLSLAGLLVVLYGILDSVLFLSWQVFGFEPPIMDVPGDGKHLLFWGFATFLFGLGATLVIDSRFTRGAEA